ncbi:MAG: hypothetical protein SFX72_14655 [Isosphaeraceae bacterium]|nr:hypothetical protein [Isosphaeraceae bacterium]
MSQCVSSFNARIRSRSAMVVRFAVAASGLVVASAADAGQVRGVFVSSPDTGTIYRGASIESLAPFITGLAGAPTGLAVGRDGVLYAGLEGTNEIAAYSPAGRELWRVSTGDRAPRGLAIDADGDLIAIELGDADAGLARFGLDGTRLDSVDIFGPAPSSLTVDTSGRIFSSDLVDGRFRRIDAAERFGFLGQDVVAIAAAPSGLLHLALTGVTNAIVTFDYDRLFPRFLVDLGIFQPQGLAVDDQGATLVSGFDGETGAYTVRRYSAAGILEATSREDLINPTFVAAAVWFVPEPSMVVTAIAGLIPGAILLARSRQRGARSRGARARVDRSE